MSWSQALRSVSSSRWDGLRGRALFLIGWLVHVNTLGRTRVVHICSYLAGCSEEGGQGGTQTTSVFIPSRCTAFSRWFRTAEEFTPQSTAIAEAFPSIMMMTSTSKPLIVRESYADMVALIPPSRGSPTRMQGSRRGRRTSHCETSVTATDSQDHGWQESSFNHRPAALLRGLGWQHHPLSPPKLAL